METSPQRLTLPLCQADCQQTQAQAAAQRDPASANRVQYGTLAMLAARYYLRLLGIASEPATEQPATEPLAWPGDLLISPAQRLRCLPVIAGQPIASSALTAPCDRSRFAPYHSQQP